MKVIFFTVLMTVLSIMLNGQTTNDPYNRIRRNNDKIHVESPTLSNFKNMVDFSTVSSTGNANIEIPIFKIDDKDIKLEIKIDYSPNRLGVDNLAAWVGTGWNLNAGGQIVRQVNHAPDDVASFVEDPWLMFKTNAFPNQTTIIHNWLNSEKYFGFDQLDYPHLIKDFPLSVHYNSDYSSENNAGKALNYYSSNHYDTEPDIFSVNIPGESFQFVFNEDGEPQVLEGFNDYIIEYEQAGDDDQSITVTDFLLHPLNHGTLAYILYDRHIKKFVITSPSGYKYFFEENGIEYTKVYQKKLVYLNIQNSDFDNELSLHEAELAPYANAWNLTKILSPNGQIAELNYTKYQIYEPIPNILEVGACLRDGTCSDATRYKFNPRDHLSEFVSRTQSDNPPNPMYPNWPWLNEPITYSTAKTHYSTDEVEVFERNLTFNDIKDWRSVKKTDVTYLSSIKTDNVMVEFIQNSIREDYPNNPKLDGIKVFSVLNNKLIKDFRFDYYYTTDLNSNEAEIPLHWKKRLFLNKIEEYPTTENINEKPLKHQFLYNENNIPRRYSTEQDAWGYYNNNNSSSLIPTIYVYPQMYKWDTYRLENIHESWNATEYILPGADRSVNENFIIAGTLEKIIFPSGGYRKYTFEPNEYWDQMARRNIKGGGLRIKLVEHGGGDIINNVRREYRYNKFEQTTKTSGVLVYPPIYAEETNNFLVHGDVFPTYVVEGAYGSNWSGTDEKKYDLFTKRTSHSISPTKDIKGNSVYYSNIEEINLSDGGRIEYEFFPSKSFENSLVQTISAHNSGCNYCDFYLNRPVSLYNNSSDQDHGLTSMFRSTSQTISPFPPLSDLNPSSDRLSGKIKQKTYFSGENLKVKKETFNYSIKEGRNAQDVFGIKQRFYEMASNPYNTMTWMVQGRAWSAVAKYKFRTNTDALLKEIITEEYFTNPTSSLISKEEFTYVPYTRLLKSEKLSTPTEIKTKVNRYVQEVIGNYNTPYSTNISTRGIWNLRDNNRIETPLQIITYRSFLESEEKVVFGELLIPKNQISFPNSNYGDFTREERFLDLSEEVNSIQDFSLDIENDEPIFDERFKTEIDYIDYDSDGNILEYKTKDGTPISFIWGYNGMHPIAKVVGLPFSSIQEQATLLKVLSNNGNLSENSFSELRSLINANNKFGQLTAYIYRPLIGVTMIIQPNGQKEIYEYDGFGRLIRVIDHNGHILKKMDYNYKP